MPITNIVIKDKNLKPENIISGVKVMGIKGERRAYVNPNFTVHDYNDPKTVEYVENGTYEIKSPRNANNDITDLWSRTLITVNVPASSGDSSANPNAFNAMIAANANPSYDWDIVTINDVNGYGLYNPTLHAGVRSPYNDTYITQLSFHVAGRTILLGPGVLWRKDDTYYEYCNSSFECGTGQYYTHYLSNVMQSLPQMGGQWMVNQTINGAVIAPQFDSNTMTRYIVRTYNPGYGGMHTLFDYPNVNDTLDTVIPFTLTLTESDEGENILEIVKVVNGVAERHAVCKFNVEIPMPMPEPCPNCEGSGVDPNTGETCEVCWGSGEVWP